MIIVAKKLWSWELNGYIDYLNNVSFCGQFWPIGYNKCNNIEGF
jgi:hypothetical protein